MKPAAPSFDKRIVTHKWGNNAAHDEFTSSNGFVLSGGSYSHTIAFFKTLAREAKRDFPKLKDSDIECFIVTESRYNKGFAGVRFSLPENAKKKGYLQASSLNFYHC